MLGDIFEISTPKGKAYLHYVYKDNKISELIRILPGLFSARPNDLKKIAEANEIFVIFFPLAFAHKKKIVEKVSNYQIVNYNKPKYMRDKHIIQKEFKGWNIVDTESWHNQLVKTLNEEQKKLSPWGIWNDTLLIERLCEGWTLDKWI